MIDDGRLPNAPMHHGSAAHKYQRQCATTNIDGTDHSFYVLSLSQQHWTLTQQPPCDHLHCAVFDGA
jgi:hypothetical protein